MQSLNVMFLKKVRLYLERYSFHLCTGHGESQANIEETSEYCANE